MSYIAKPFVFIDPVCVFPAYLDSSVRAEAVDYDDFIGPLDAFEASTDISFFVAGSNTS